MWKIKAGFLQEIFNSRGEPTLEVILTLNDLSRQEVHGTFACPTGASVGKKEVFLENDLHTCKKKFLQSILPKLLEKKFDSVFELDNYMLHLQDNCPIGSNITLACSIAFIKAQSKILYQPLYQIIWDLLNNLETFNYQKSRSYPTIDLEKINKNLYPWINIVNGGMHADNKLEIQEFMIIPTTPQTFIEKIYTATQFYHHLRLEAKLQKLTTNTGDEGGLALQLNNTIEVLELLKTVQNKSQFKLKWGLDLAASNLLKINHSNLKKQYSIDSKFYSFEELQSLYQSWIAKYPIWSLEDPLSEEAPLSEWKQLKQALKTYGTLIISDDFTVTNPQIISQTYQGYEAVIIKPNQIGSLTKTLEAIQQAKRNNIKVIISHRSAETEDNFLAHLAVGVAADGIKSGGVTRSERLAKYNEIIRILGYPNYKYKFL